MQHEKLIYLFMSSGSLLGWHFVPVHHVICNVFGCTLSDIDSCVHIGGYIVLVLVGCYVQLRKKKEK